MSWLGLFPYALPSFPVLISKYATKCPELPCRKLSVIFLPTGILMNTNKTDALDSSEYVTTLMQPKALPGISGFKSGWGFRRS